MFPRSQESSREKSSQFMYQRPLLNSITLGSFSLYLALLFLSFCIILKRGFPSIFYNISLFRRWFCFVSMWVCYHPDWQHGFRLTGSKWVGLGWAAFILVSSSRTCWSSEMRMDWE
jgi:drug/metabolite transporter (DMT)-like permease